MKRSLITLLAGPVMTGLIVSNLAEIVRAQGHDDHAARDKPIAST